jgi:arabinose-5-phosphate isomerase
MKPPPAASTSLASDVLRHEARALLKLADELDIEQFEAAVTMLVNAGGNVATVGAGTSGIIAQKIAATLTSTGTPALFVHPGDALHGGLGAIGNQAVVIAVSNSGETDEVLSLLPYLHARKVPVISIVGNARSTLAQKSDVVLEAVAEAEADPHGLVPTSSATLALAVGDALALTVMTVKGVTPETFAANHPSGRLGRRLTLRVRDVMHGGAALPQVDATTRLLDAVSAITTGALGAVVVLDDAARLLGIVTDGDIRRAIERCGTEELRTLEVVSVMTSQPVTVAADAMAYAALQLMEDRPSQIGVLPVVDGERCVGMVRLHDLVRIGL